MIFLWLAFGGLGFYRVVIIIFLIGFYMLVFYHEIGFKQLEKIVIKNTKV
jgi:hypothetical protein